ncbi:MAG: hypothetical protein ABI082_10135 [Dokdonella sp.]
MFRVNEIFHSIAHFVRESEMGVAISETPRPSHFVADDSAGALMPVYSEIARRLSRSTYTRHSAA